MPALDPIKKQLSEFGLQVERILRNPPVAVMIEEALRHEAGTQLSASGAIVARSGKKTGRSPGDKRIVRHPDSEDEIWWGPVNIELDEHTFAVNRARAVDYLNTRPQIFVIDGFAGWDPNHRLKVRIVCERAYHALFMHNMLIRPRPDELESFGAPDFVVINGGCFPANVHTERMTSNTSVSLSFERKEFVILGTEYAGEMKKGVFTIMNYLMPKHDVLSMHCSCNEGQDGDVSIFFGLSGTGKTTLSADPRRALIGDDEHCWSDDGVFNIEGGCYAKTVHLTQEKEPEIFKAIRFGAVLENVVLDEATREADFDNTSITQNTRCSYPIEFIRNAKIPCVGAAPSNILFLTADAFSVLPPVSKLTAEQAMYHFISGYTAKVAGTEVGITEPEATFSACFGAPFLVWHPLKYAEMLATKIKNHSVDVWLVNTGWIGGPYGVGRRISLEYTRAIIDAIHDGSLKNQPTEAEPVFGLQIPSACAGVPSEVLKPWQSWIDKDAYDAMAKKLARLFIQNFRLFSESASPELLAAGPHVASGAM